MTTRGQSDDKTSFRSPMFNASPPPIGRIPLGLNILIDFWVGGRTTTGAGERFKWNAESQFQLPWNGSLLSYKMSHFFSSDWGRFWVTCSCWLMNSRICSSFDALHVWGRRRTPSRALHCTPAVNARCLRSHPNIQEMRQHDTPDHMAAWNHKLFAPQKCQRGNNVIMLRLHNNRFL